LLGKSLIAEKTIIRRVLYFLAGLAAIFLFGA